MCLENFPKIEHPPTNLPSHPPPTPCSHVITDTCIRFVRASYRRIKNETQDFNYILQRPTLA